MQRLTHNYIDISDAGIQIIGPDCTSKTLYPRDPAGEGFRLPFGDFIDMRVRFQPWGKGAV